MAIFCDVVLPVPLDRAFTYKLKDEDGPPVGGRVVVPFRNEKLIGVVTRLHDEAPPVEARLIEAVLDQEPILNAELMELAAWIAQYYLAPLGEVLRSMLPLMAEVRRSTSYRISETGQAILFDGAAAGFFAPLAPHRGRTKHRVHGAELSLRRTAGKERNPAPCHRRHGRAVDQHAAQEVAAARNRSRASRCPPYGALCGAGGGCAAAQTE